MKSNIGIINAWGSNRGDEAMLSSFLCHIETRYPGATTTIYSNEYLDLDRFRVTVEPWPRDLIDFLPRTRLLSPITVFYRRLAYCARLLARRTGCKNKPHQVVVSAPAGPYIGDLYPATEPKCLSMLLWCRRYGIPFGILAVSAGPFNKSFWNNLRIKILNNSKFFSLRENISCNSVTSLGLSTEVLCGADLVFAHPERQVEQYLPEQLVSEFRRTEEIFSKPTVILSLNYTPYLTSDGRQKPFDQAEYSQQMGRLLKHVRETTGANVIIFPHFYGNRREMSNIRSVINGAGDREGFFVLDPRFNAEMQMALYKRATFVISHRYHPTIFAIRARRPFLCIRHQFKVDGMLDMFGETGPKVTTVDNTEKWIKAFEYGWANKEKIEESIELSIVAVTKGANLHLEIFDKYFADHIRGDR